MIKTLAISLVAVLATIAAMSLTDKQSDSVISSQTHSGVHLAGDSHSHDGSSDHTHDHDESESPAVSNFLDALTYGVGLDYEPVSSPAEANKLTDIQVVGRVVDVTDGVDLHEATARRVPSAAKIDPGELDPEIYFDGDSNPQFLEPEGSPHIGLVVEVERVIGKPGDVEVPKVIEIQMYGGTRFTPSQLADMNPDARIVVALETWTTDELRAADMVPVYTSGRAVPDTFHFPLVDAVWFSDGGSLVSPYVHSSEIAPGWQRSLRSVEALEAALSVGTR